MQRIRLFLQLVLVALTACSETQAPTTISMIGNSCMIDANCREGKCLDESNSGYPGGICVSPCNETSSCAQGSSCVELNSRDQYCLPACNPSSPDCRDGYACADSGFGSAGVCVPQCTSDTQCRSPAVCDSSRGICSFPEDCSAVGDEDFNGVADCNDPVCAETSPCPLDIDSACSNAVEIFDTITSNTMGSHALFSATCTGYDGAPEKVFHYVASVSGTLIITLDSQTDLGIYVRSSCADPMAEMECRDEQGPGIQETLALPIESGEEYFIFVDGYESPSAAGPFTLSVTLAQ